MKAVTFVPVEVADWKQKNGLIVVIKKHTYRTQVCCSRSVERDDSAAV